MSRQVPAHPPAPRSQVRRGKLSQQRQYSTRLPLRTALLRVAERTVDRAAVGADELEALQPLREHVAIKACVVDWCDGD